MKPLTRKQASILEHLADGLRLCQIAERSGMDESSVKTQIGRARAKLGAKTTFQAVAFYERERIKGEI